MKTDETRCPHVTELLSAHVDGELCPSERSLVEGHLPSCPRCREELARLRRAVGRVRALPRAVATEGYLHQVRARIRAGRDRSFDLVAWLTHKPAFHAVGLAGATLVLTIVVYDAYPSRVAQQTVDETGRPVAREARVAASPLVAKPPPPEEAKAAAVQPPLAALVEPSRDRPVFEAERATRKDSAPTLAAQGPRPGGAAPEPPVSRGKAVQAKEKSGTGAGDSPGLADGSSVAGDLDELSPEDAAMERPDVTATEARQERDAAAPTVARAAAGRRRLVGPQPEVFRAPAAVWAGSKAGEVGGQSARQAALGVEEPAEAAASPSLAVPTRAAAEPANLAEVEAQRQKLERSGKVLTEGHVRSALASVLPGDTEVLGGRRALDRASATLTAEDVTVVATDPLDFVEHVITAVKAGLPFDVRRILVLGTGVELHLEYAGRTPEVVQGRERLREAIAGAASLHHFGSRAGPADTSPFVRITVTPHAR